MWTWTQVRGHVTWNWKASHITKDFKLLNYFKLFSSNLITIYIYLFVKHVENTT